MSILSAEVQREKQRPERDTKNDKKTDTEDLLETLYWNIHGGNIYHLWQCL